MSQTIFGRALKALTLNSQDDLILQSPALLEQSIFVNYSQNFEAMIAVGKYNWKDKDITPQHFPIVGEGSLELKPQLFHFSRTLNSKRIKEILDKKNKRPGLFEEALAFGVTY